jgi:membrane-associated phospholipid phosphatase
MPEEPNNTSATQEVQQQAQAVIKQAQQEVASSRSPWYTVFRRTRVLVAIYLCMFLLFGGLALFVHVHPILSIDVLITQEFQEYRPAWLNGLMLAVSYLGSNFIILALLILLTAVIFWVVQLRLEALMIAGLSIVSTALNVGIKLLVSRPRPATPVVVILQQAAGYSFPSGHVMSYVAFWGLLFSLGLILFKRNHWWHYALLVISGLFVVLVGPSRIYLGDHWASDVLGAYIFGGLLLGLTLWLYLVLKSRGILAAPPEPGTPVIEPQPTHVSR